MNLSLIIEPLQAEFLVGVLIDSLVAHGNCPFTALSPLIILPDWSTTASSSSYPGFGTLKDLLITL